MKAGTAQYFFFISNTGRRKGLKKPKQKMKLPEHLHEV